MKLRIAITPLEWRLKIKSKQKIKIYLHLYIGPIQITFHNDYHQTILRIDAWRKEKGISIGIFGKYVKFGINIINNRGEQVKKIFNSFT